MRAVECFMDGADEEAFLAELLRRRPGMHLEDYARFIAKQPFVISAIGEAAGPVVFAVDAAAWPTRPAPGPGSHLVQFNRTHRFRDKLTAGRVAVTYQDDDPVSVAVTAAAMDALKATSTLDIEPVSPVLTKKLRIGRHALSTLGAEEVQLLGAGGGPDYRIKETRR